MQWSEVNEEVLRDLYYVQNMSDRMIAGKFDVKPSQVAYKRKKYGISNKNRIYEEILNPDSALNVKLNQESKLRLCRQENIDGIAKALTHYVFRNGPVEDMHSDGKLTQEDMKVLNKYMVDRFAGILSYIGKGNWLHLELIYDYYNKYGSGWDNAVPDTEEMDIVLEYFIEELKEN